VPPEKRKEIREYFGENSFMANGKWKYKEGIAPIFSLKTDYKGAMGYVTQADSDLISIKVFGIPTAQKLMMDRFKLSDDNEMILNVSSELEKAQLFDKLRSYDLAFAGGREWSPAEVFEYLVDKGFLTSGYKKITWTDANAYKITDVI
jgi:hypothetical protein